MGVTAQVSFTADELLASDEIAEPLLAHHSGGTVRCHGGFDADGNYVSPRTKYRRPAIEAWQQRHRELFGTELLHVPLDTWPENVPNVAQARLLVERGVPEPLIATLTRIGTVEGYGANIRLLQPRGWQRYFVEDIAGTAVAHLGEGLFEAHGRDEAGWEEEAGHKDMWFAVRDVAFEGRSADVDIEAMLERMGLGQQGAALAQGRRLLPDVIEPELELVVGLMVRVLLIELSAYRTFAWAEEWLSDPDLVAGDGEAARIVSYIRADETPHVGYLATALTELRDRTWIGTDGSRHPGTEMVGRLWDHHLGQSLGANRDASRAAILGEVEHWCRRHPNGEAILEEFYALATPEAA
jgi:hypothetical protein